MATVQAHRRKTITIMKKLNVYKPEFSPLIYIYAGLRSQYDTLMEKWELQDLILRWKQCKAAQRKLRS